MSESASISELKLAERILADLAVLTSSIMISEEKQLPLGFKSEEIIANRAVGYGDLKAHFDNTPGLVSDKLKAVLRFVWGAIPSGAVSGVVFAYDEAQNLTDHRKNEQYPLSVLLDVFQSIQRADMPFLLILAGLPTLLPKLVEARTYSERMFHTVFLRPLNREDSREAIIKPVEDSDSKIVFSSKTVDIIIEMSGGYPYFIQFMCREVYDSLIVQLDKGMAPNVPTQDIIRKLDNDFFAGRWSRATDRQRDLLRIIANLENCDSEFTVQEVIQASKKGLNKSFSSSHANQMLSSLSDHGLVYKNRHGRYSFAVPLLSEFIKRQMNT